MNIGIAGEYVILPLSEYRRMLEANQPRAPLAQMAGPEESAAVARAAPTPQTAPLPPLDLSAPAGFVATRPETLARLARSAGADDGRNSA